MGFVTKTEALPGFAWQGLDLLFIGRYRQRVYVSFTRFATGLSRMRSMA